MKSRQDKQRRFAWVQHVIEGQAASGFGMAMVVLCGCLGYAQAVPNSALTVTIAVIMLYEFQKRLNQGVPLLQLTALIAVLQWLVGPTLNYSTSFKYGRYAMYVPEAEYFRFALPATAFYVTLMLAIGASVRQKNLFQNVQRRGFIEVGFVLNAIAFAAAIGAPRVGTSLAFLLHLISQLRYVGALYFLFSRHQLRIFLAIASCVPLVTDSLGSGMFHDLILWLAILFCFWFAQRNWTLPVKMLVLTTAALALFSIQVIKFEYREQLRKNLSPSLISLVYEYVSPGGRAWDADALSLAVTRLNQGWIISAIMHNVPKNVPHAKGETIKDAVASSVVPRFLWKGKKKAGGRDNFRRFTGLDIQESTSMGISPLGEGYANFGVNGGIIFMLAFGALFAVMYRLILRYALRHPTFIFWIPLIFYQAIKAETEILVVLNQLTKGAVVAFAFHALTLKILPPPRRLPTRPAESTDSVLSG